MPGVKRHGQRASLTDLVIWISNLDDLVAAYGSNFHSFAVSTVYERLADCGIHAHALQSSGDIVLVDLSAASRLSSFFQRQVTHALSSVAKDRLPPFIQAVAGRDPVEHAGICAYLRVQVRYLCRAEREADSRPKESVPARGDAWQWPTIPPRQDARCQEFRADMTLVCRLLNDLREGRLALAFQPIAMFGSMGGDARLYSEALLRHVAGERAAYSLPDAIEALERLGLVFQLDHSVIWTLIRLLESHPLQTLGCNVSARSLREDAWWHELLAYLEANRSIASRLTLEITETAPIACVREALALLAGLRRTGVRIALDDMGAGWSSLDFLAKARADVVKIDRSALLRSYDAGDAADPMHDLIRRCIDHSPCIIVEGIETSAELLAARHAGAHGIQGSLVEAPTLRPAWLDIALVRVADTCVQAPCDDEMAPLSDGFAAASQGIQRIG